MVEYIHALVAYTPVSNVEVAVAVVEEEAEEEVAVAVVEEQGCNQKNYNLEGKKGKLHTAVENVEAAYEEYS